MKHISVLDGSLGAPHGNTSRLVKELVTHLPSGVAVTWVNLKQESPTEAQLHQADGFIFASGTYWDSWGSPLQKFLEDATKYEGSDLWLGKPAAVVITMHSVGGKAVLSRLQGVLSTLGLVIPPMSGMTYSLANHLALKAQPNASRADLWSPADLEVIAKNLLKALSLPRDWAPWPVHPGDGVDFWYRSP